MTRIRKVLTFSNIVACLALFLALGGTVYAAGKISGKQIKANSLPGNRIKSKTLTGKQIKSGSLTGTQINQTTLTGVSAASLASVSYVTASGTVPGSGNPSNGTSVTANCPAGTFVIGGGATLSSEEKGEVNDSGPGSSHTSWTATFYGEPGGASLTVTAICTAVKTVG